MKQRQKQKELTNMICGKFHLDIMKKSAHLTSVGVSSRSTMLAMGIVRRKARSGGTGGQCAQIQRKDTETERPVHLTSVGFVCWLLNIPATCDGSAQFYVLPH